jgi:hypothetical protein
MTVPTPKFIGIITLIVLLATVYNYTEAFNSEISRVKSNVDKRKYIVLNLPDRNIAADRLARLRIKLTQFINHMMKQKHLPEIVGIRRLHKKFKAVISESKPGTKYTSYTLNKGTQIFMCIREREHNNRLIDENTCFFVALHELAHVMTTSIGHTKEFWDNFKFLLKHAIKEGYYIYHPYHSSPKKYCGTYISDTPLKL